MDMDLPLPWIHPSYELREGHQSHPQGTGKNPLLSKTEVKPICLWERSQKPLAPRTQGKTHYYCGSKTSYFWGKTRNHFGPRTLDQYQAEGGRAGNSCPESTQIKGRFGLPWERGAGSPTLRFRI